MIDSNDYIKQTGVYIKDGHLWRIVGFCQSPSVTMERIGTITEIRESFGIDGFTNSTFSKVEGLIYDHENQMVKPNAS
jgi:hypothetical protein